MPRDRIDPDYEPHDILENDVRDYLKKHGFLVEELTYHKQLPPQMVGILQNRYSPTALYLRGRADRIAIHKSQPVEFEWEAKTHKSENRHDLLLEAMPLIHHLSKASFGIKCLYIYRDPFTDNEAGFWVYDMPPIRETWIPSNRWDDNQRNWFRHHIHQWFPDVKHMERPIQYGSRDPFIIIDESVVNRLSHWTELIQSELESANKIQP